MTEPIEAGPVFLSERALISLHDDVIRMHGGPAGMNAALVASVASYPAQKYSYADVAPDIAALGAYLAFAAATFHPFTDGNKRVALAALDTFLIQNGYELTSSDAENVSVMRALAGSEMSESDLVLWVTARSAPLTRRE